MHSSRMRTVRNSSRLLSGGSPHPPPEQAPHWSRHLHGNRPPWSRHPPGANPPRAAPPWSRHPPRSRPRCCKACWDTTCNACWDSTPPATRHAGIPPAMHAGKAHPSGQNDTCKNITFATSLRTVNMSKFVVVQFSVSRKHTILLIFSAFLMGFNSLFMYSGLLVFLMFMQPWCLGDEPLVLCVLKGTYEIIDFLSLNFFSNERKLVKLEFVHEIN